MEYSRQNFNSRLRGLGRKHSAMANGYTTQMRRDGLVVIKPKRVARRGIPLKGILLFVGGFLAFKGFLLASLGPDAYVERVGTLNEGTIIEQAGAWVMQADPATQMIAEQLGPVLR